MTMNQTIPAKLLDEQSVAYETCLRLAAEHRWNRVYELMMQDGFDRKMDYVQLLALWDADSWLQENMQAEFCTACGAGLGKHRRAGEGTCPECDPAQERPT